MENNSSSGKEPKLRALYQVSNWRHEFFAFCIQKDLMEPLLSNFDANTAALITKNRLVYGYCLSALSDFTDLRDRMMNIDTLNPANPETFVPDGSLLFRSIVEEGLVNAGEAYYQGVLSSIDQCSQGVRPFPDFVKELNDLYKQLPASLTPSDALKRVKLRRAIHQDLSVMATASSLKPNITYDGLCSDLLGEYYQQAANKRTSAAALTESTKLVTAATSEETIANYSNFHGGRTAIKNRKLHHHRHDSRHDDRQNYSQTIKKPFTGTCFNCKKTGHRIADCYAPGGPKEKMSGKRGLNDKERRFKDKKAKK